MQTCLDLNTIHSSTGIAMFQHHLPLKKRMMRPVMATYPIMSNLMVTPPKAQLPTKAPKSEAGSLSPCSFASLDSGFCDVEPLDLSFNSTIPPSSRANDDASPKSRQVCPQCNKVYESNSRFRAHLRRHESKMSGRYRCGVCSKNFVQRSSLKTHERIHTGEKPYHCGTCGERFGDFSTFTKHGRTHSGEKPYQCPICERSFSQSGNMHRHLKVVHKPRLDLYPHQWCDQQD